MAGSESVGAARGIVRAGLRTFAARAERWLQGETPLVSLVLMAGLPVLGGVWLLVAPDRLLSREMTWDLLFNLSGAWRIENGQRPHVDFHDPVGALSFMLTCLGFQIVGLSPRAFLAGQVVFLAVIFLTAAIAAYRRLPPIPAAIFVVYACLLILMPVNIGDQPNAYSFAMSYNRWAWSALTCLCLILFLAPRRHPCAPPLDVVTGGLLLVAMFYLKITFAVAGLAALAVAMVVSDHVRTRWIPWSLVLAAVVANALGPHSHAYLSDIWQAANAGYVRNSWQDHVRSVLDNNTEYALYGSGVMVLLWLWRCGQASLKTVAAAGFILCMGAFVLSQNAQAGGIPVGMVIAFLIYDAVRDAPHATASASASETAPRLLAILVFPALATASSAATLVGYHLATTRDSAVLMIDDTNLRGLVVPVDGSDAAGRTTTAEVPYALRSRVRDAHPRDGLSQAEYVRTLVEAASLFDDERRGRPRILVLDQVNPLPFMLGFPPARGGNLWQWPGAPDRPADGVFNHADYVLIPKLSTYAGATANIVARYAPYLAEQFPLREETTSWIILSRAQSTAAQPADLSTVPGSR